MRRLRKTPRTPSCALALRSGYADQFLGLKIVTFQLGILERPVRGHAKPALHFHRIGMNAMRLAREVQCAAADATDVMIFIHQPRAVRDHRPEPAASSR